MRQVKIGLIGGGTVGGGLCTALITHGDLLSARLGARITLQRVAVKDPRKKRAAPLPTDRLTADWKAVVADPEAQIIVELMGGTSIAREVVTAALQLGKPVVTANKALLSAHGPELFALAERHNTNLYYEASVAGGIPIIKILRESLAGNRILSIHGIVNGTCNYILSRMTREGLPMATVLAEAQRLGYAEAEPSLDIDGHDAAHKTGILASLAHGFWVRPDQIHTEGIRNIDARDIQFAGKLGYTVKLLGVVKWLPRAGRGGSAKPAVQVSVYPALIPNSHVLASVHDAFNAIAVRGDVVGDTLFYGRGAGAAPTASSVLSDLADAARDLVCGSGRRVPPFVACAKNITVQSLDDVVSRYYVRLSVVDRPGVFARIATILAKARIGISSIIQPEGHEGDTVPVILMIHDAPNAAMKKALESIRALPVVKSPPVMIRVESFEA